VIRGCLWPFACPAHGLAPQWRSGFSSQKACRTAENDQAYDIYGTFSGARAYRSAQDQFNACKSGIIYSLPIYKAFFIGSPQTIQKGPSFAAEPIPLSFAPM